MLGREWARQIVNWLVRNTDLGVKRAHDVDASGDWWTVIYLSDSLSIRRTSPPPTCRASYQISALQTPLPALLSESLQEGLICRLCIELWNFFDACGVSSCGIWAGRRRESSSRTRRKQYDAMRKHDVIRNTENT